MLSVRCLSVLSCLSVCDKVCCGQTVRQINMELGMQVSLGPAYIVLDATQLPSPIRRLSPQFSAHVYCGQTAGWIKMVGLGPTTLY